MGRDGINFDGISNVKVEFTPLQKLWVLSMAASNFV